MCLLSAELFRLWLVTCIMVYQIVHKSIIYRYVHMSLLDSVYLLPFVNWCQDKSDLLRPPWIPFPYALYSYNLFSPWMGNNCSNCVQGWRWLAHWQAENRTLRESDAWHQQCARGVGWPWLTPVCVWNCRVLIGLISRVVSERRPACLTLNSSLSGLSDSILKLCMCK